MDFFYENISISIQTSLKFVPNAPINNIPICVYTMAWRSYNAAYTYTGDQQICSIKA